MSSWREVFIRILALLQRKTLLETKNRTLKCLKRHYSTVHVTTRAIHEKCCSVEGGRPGYLPSFFVPTPGDSTAQECPTPGVCPPRQKNANAWLSAQGGGGLGAV